MYRVYTYTYIRLTYDYTQVNAGDIQVNTSDIRVTYEYMRVTYGWHTSTYEWHMNNIRMECKMIYAVRRKKVGKKWRIFLPMTNFFTDYLFTDKLLINYWLIDKLLDNNNKLVDHQSHHVPVQYIQSSQSGAVNGSRSPNDSKYKPVGNNSLQVKLNWEKIKIQIIKKIMLL